MSNDIYGGPLNAHQGKRWTKIAHPDFGARAFIDLITGEAFAAKSWKAPNLRRPLTAEERDDLLVRAGLRPIAPVSTLLDDNAAEAELTAVELDGTIVAFTSRVDLTDDNAAEAELAERQAVVEAELAEAEAELAATREELAAAEERAAKPKRRRGKKVKAEPVGATANADAADALAYLEAQMDAHLATAGALDRESVGDGEVIETAGALEVPAEGEPRADEVEPYVVGELIMVTAATMAFEALPGLVMDVEYDGAGWLVTALFPTGETHQYRENEVRLHAEIGVEDTTHYPAWTVVGLIHTATNKLRIAGVHRGFNADHFTLAIDESEEFVPFAHCIHAADEADARAKAADYVTLWDEVESA